MKRYLRRTQNTLETSLSSSYNAVVYDETCECDSTLEQIGLGCDYLGHYIFSIWECFRCKNKIKVEDTRHCAFAHLANVNCPGNLEYLGPIKTSSGLFSSHRWICDICGKISYTGDLN